MIKKDHLQRALLARLLAGSILGVDDVLPPLKKKLRRRRRLRRLVKL